jgi:putative membrane protein
MLRYNHSAGWHAGLGLFGWLFFVAIVALAVMFAVSLFRMPRIRLHGPAAQPPTAPHQDAAEHELRLRYARGEIDRDEFVTRLTDLGGRPPGDTAPSTG